MDITVYKRGKDGKKLHEELKTKAIQIRFKERDINIEKKIYIGRNKTNAISITNDPLVSRKHALIEYISGSYLLSDLNSTNGTYLNSQPVPCGRKLELISGDVVRVGKTKINIS